MVKRTETKESTEISEQLLLDLWASKDRGLKLTFDDVLAGLERAKVPHREGIYVDRIVPKILEAYRDRIRGAKGYSAKSFRVFSTGTAAPQEAKSPSR